jgi:hypothetical protein
VYTALIYGNATLYGVLGDRLGTINVTTGAFTAMAGNPVIDNCKGLIVKSATELMVVSGNSLITITIATGAIVYTKQDLR